MFSLPLAKCQETSTPSIFQPLISCGATTDKLRGAIPSRKVCRNLFDTNKCEKELAFHTRPPLLENQNVYRVERER